MTGGVRCVRDKLVFDGIVNTAIGHVRAVSVIIYTSQP